uniref:Uncharacterized protein n=1 Tax=Candidatus Kentrum sp. DK TaxID=2126562 RepID=A0A450SI24_9GAMM|nr:MAG: hypothetical protein BECKDK2373B_GA0170837_104014 [Candidatus Kentron sp. DK]
MDYLTRICANFGRYPLFRSRIILSPTGSLGRAPNKHVGKNKIGLYNELYAKVRLRPLTSLKTRSKCSFTPCKLRFFACFRLVMKHNLTFAFTSNGTKFSVAFPSIGYSGENAMSGIRIIVYLILYILIFFAVLELMSAPESESE